MPTSNALNVWTTTHTRTYTHATHPFLFSHLRIWLINLYINIYIGYWFRPVYLLSLQLCFGFFSHFQVVHNAPQCRALYPIVQSTNVNLYIYTHSVCREPFIHEILHLYHPHSHIVTVMKVGQPSPCLYAHESREPSWASATVTVTYFPPPWSCSWSAPTAPAPASPSRGAAGQASSAVAAAAPGTPGNQAMRK